MRVVEWTSALVGTAICIVGAVVTASAQIEPFGPAIRQRKHCGRCPDWC